MQVFPGLGGRGPHGPPHEPWGKKHYFHIWLPKILPGVPFCMFKGCPPISFCLNFHPVFSNLKTKSDHKQPPPFAFRNQNQQLSAFAKLSTLWLASCVNRPHAKLVLPAPGMFLQVKFVFTAIAKAFVCFCRLNLSYLLPLGIFL